MDRLTDADIIKGVLEAAAKGFATLGELASASSISQDRLLKKLRRSGIKVGSFEEIAALRVYSITPNVGDVRWKHLSYTAIQGLVTGSPGALGIPFNIAASFFLFFRAAQTIALHYGYDAQKDPAEAEIASQVALLSLDPRLAESSSHLGSLLGKMALAGELTVLRTALRNSTYQQMAKRGKSTLLYVQLRALANKAAKKALHQSGNKGLEAGIFKGMLEVAAKQLPKTAGIKWIPILGGLITASIDSHLMNRVLKGARILYAKRFLMEKEDRVKHLSELNSASRKSRNSAKKRTSPKRSKI